MVVTCPNCAKQNIIPAELRSRPTQCVHCQAPIAPLATTKGAPPAYPKIQCQESAEPPRQAAVSAGDAADQQAKANRTTRATKPVRRSAIVSLILSAVTILGATVLFIASPRIIFECFAPVAVAATLAGLIAIQKTRSVRVRGRWMAVIGLTAGLLGLAGTWAFAVFLPERRQQELDRKRRDCDVHLMEIALAILDYRNSHRQSFPPDLATLVKQGKLTSAQLVCPFGHDTAAGSADQIGPGHLSFTYLGGNISWHESRPGVVLLYENPECRPDGTTRLLDTEGNNGRLTRAQTEWLIKELAAGHNPPPWNEQPPD
jgi:hypothetical protein